MSVTYVNKTDPVEMVEIVSQERTPNGYVIYNMISPGNMQGMKMRANAFFETYKNSAEVEKTLERPHSGSSKEEWREYALRLEAELKL